MPSFVTFRDHVIGTPEFSTDGWDLSIRDAFGNASHGTITKTYSVTHLALKEAGRRYSPAEVVAVARDVVSGVPAQIGLASKQAIGRNSNVAAHKGASTPGWVLSVFDLPLS
jgi:hypothetical protein